MQSIINGILENGVTSSAMSELSDYVTITMKDGDNKTVAYTIADGGLKYTFNKNGKIITLKSKKDYTIKTNDIVDFYKKNDYKVISVCCTEVTSYTPWGFFQNVFKDYFSLPRCNEYIDAQKINPLVIQKYKKILDLILYKPVKASMYEDARFAYMEQWNKFLSILDKTLALSIASSSCSLFIVTAILFGVFVT